MNDTVLKRMWSSGTVTVSPRNGEENHFTNTYHSGAHVSSDLIGVECYTYVMRSVVLKMPSVILPYIPVDKARIIYTKKGQNS
jgi:hypothetical protein